jgi:hypothetical protein
MDYKRDLYIGVVTLGGKELARIEATLLEIGQWAEKMIAGSGGDAEIRIWRKDDSEENLVWADGRWQRKDGTDLSK